LAHPQDNKLVVSSLSLLICLSAFTVDVTLPVLPTIAEALNVDPRLGQMTISLYLLGYALGQVPYGLLSDRFGRIPVIYGGLILFILTGFLNAFATNINELLIYRFLQGIAGAVAPVLSRAIIRDISSGHRTVELMSVMTIALGLSTLTAPIIGSLLATTYGWRSTLFSTAIISIFLVILFLFVLKETKPEHASGDTLWQQLKNSVSAFINESQSIWAMCMIALAFGGYASILISTAPILQNRYGFDTNATGIILGLSMVPYFTGAIYSHRKSAQIGILGIVRLAVILFGITAILLIPITYIDNVPFLIFWPALLFYFLAIGVIMPSANALILNPLPKTAGFASSITGTVQVGTGAVASALTAMFISSSTRGLAGVIILVGILIIGVYFCKVFVTFKSR
jgi:DHA1 family bicyclomycin/chloramphenicol resistance-like MFS transporter